MSAKITILPTGHKFVLQAGESILEGALRHGKALDYSCNSGTCGRCKASLISGQLKKCNHADYVFSREEKRKGAILLCCHAAESDEVVVQAHEDVCADDIPLQEIETKVSKLVMLSDEWINIEVKTPRTKSMRFLAGQHVRLKIKGVAERNKSIASCPCNGRQLQFHVRNTGGEFSDYIFNQLKKNAVVSLEGPVGEFVMNDETTKPLIFVAFDAGFAPIKSLIEHSLSLGLEQPIKLFWISTVKQPYLYNICRSWDDALDNFSFEVMCLEDGWRPETVADGVVEIIDSVSHFAEKEFFLTVPRNCIDLVDEKFTQASVPENQYFIDKMQWHD
jgi:CDP-4-dehydro-6-deoxyglucose reductase, E3